MFTFLLRLQFKHVTHAADRHGPGVGGGSTLLEEELCQFDMAPP